jgi:hypothetical protein
MKCGATESPVSEKFYISNDQVMEMTSGGMYFGVHLISHNLISRLQGDNQRRTICEGMILKTTKKKLTDNRVFFL